MDVSTVPKLINSKRIKIFDENFIPISICKKTNELFDSYFVHPFLVIDSFEASNYIDVQIETLELDQLSKLNYRLVAVSLKGTSKSKRNYIGQRTAYVLRRKTDSLGRDVEMYNLPRNHQLQIDVLNKRIRIKGRDARPYIRNDNASKWIDINAQIKK